MSMPRDLPPLIAGPDLARLLRRNRGPIQCQGVVVVDRLELQSCEFDYRVELRGAVFVHRVLLRDIRFHRTVDLRGCVFLGGLVLEGSCVGGSLLMDGAVIGPARPRSGPGPGEAAAARMTLLRVRGDLLARGLICAGDLDLTRVDVRGRLELASTPERPVLVAGTLRAGAASVGGDVRMHGIQVTGDLDAEGIRVGGKLTLEGVPDPGAQESGAILFGALVGRDLNLAGARIVGDLNLRSAIVGGQVSLQTAEVRGGVFLRCTRGYRPVLMKDFHARGARIHGTVDLSGALVFGRLSLEGIFLFGTFFMQDAWGSYEGPPEALRLSPVRPNLRPAVWGDVALTNAHVHGSMKLHGAWLMRGLTLNAAVVSSSVDISKAWIDGDFRLTAATIKGDLRCVCADRSAPRIGGGLRARAARIDSGVTFAGAILEKEADFAGSCISGPVSFVGGCVGTGKEGTRDIPIDQLPCHIGRVLDFSDAVIAGSLEAHGLRAHGGVRLARAEVRGSVELLNAVLGPLPAASPRKVPRGDQPVRASLDAVGARLRGALRLSGALAVGAVNLQNARIGGGLFCGRAVPDGEDRESRTVLAGPVMLDGSEVLTQADFSGALIHGELSLERARVEGRLRCDVSRHEPGVAALQSLDVRNARIRHLHLTWRPAPGPQTVPILMEGCVFHDVTVPEKDYAGLFGPDGGEFRQPGYLAVERWLRERGEDDAAERVYDRMRDRRRSTLRVYRRPGDFFVGWMRKGALHFQALSFASLVMYAVSVFVFADPASHVRGKANRVDSAAVQLSPATSATPAERPARPATMSLLPASGLASAPPVTGRDTSSWTYGDAALLAARFHLPMLTLPGKDQWEPSREHVWRSVRYDGYATVVSVLSYIVVPLVITGIVSTWLQRRSASG